MSTPYQILIGLSNQKDEIGRACGTQWESRYAYRGLVGNPEGKK